MKKPFVSSLIWLLGAALLVSGLAWGIRVNIAGGGPTTMNAILNNLRCIDGAKQAWAWENHETNDVVVTREMLDGVFGPAGYDARVRPAARERYVINTLCKPPEAELTKKVGPYPRGTVVRFGTNGYPVFVSPVVH